MYQDISIYANKFYRQLSMYEQRKFKNDNICAICGNIIEKYEMLCIQKRRNGRKVEYKFAHQECFNLEQVNLFNGSKLFNEYI